MAEFKRPPGPPSIYAAIHENGHVLYTSPNEIEGLPESIAVTPYVPEWEREKWKDEYRALAEAQFPRDEKFEDALVAVKMLADQLGTQPMTTWISAALARAKELAPGAWIIKR